MASKMIQLQEDVYRRLKKRKGARSFSSAVDELLATAPTTDGDEILRRLGKWEGVRLLGKRASARHKRAG